MRKWLYSLFLVLVAFSLSACSDDPSIDGNPKEQVVTPENNEEVNTPDNQRVDDSGNKSHGTVQDQDIKSQIDELQFSKFDLEVEYGVENDFEFEYEQRGDNGEIYAELKDAANEKVLKGMEAFQALYSALSGVDMEAISSTEEAVNIVMDAFQLDRDYKSFELEYTLKDGTKKEFKDK